ncbi:MAG: MmcQ/YjbR family DNA-binding protein [Rhodobacteraceae bacterium]|jgi:hypothetical protein|nr:MmcQ/YjbR family DNA-binding protein [Paracoccaceae bacterium]
MTAQADPIRTYGELKALGLGLGLPEVVETTAWGNPCLKAHGRMWVWWSPYADAAVFPASFDEREMLMAADPETFFLHPHYLKHPYVLVRAGRIDRGWATARLIAQWRAAAPKRWLKAWDAAKGGA